MTPFVDVMLVLLVIFMITAPLLATGVQVDLPKTLAAQLADQNDALSVSVDKHGRIFLQDNEVALAALGAKLKAVTNNNQDIRIFVRGDDAISYGQVMTVLGAVYDAGFRKVALLTEFVRRQDRRSAADGGGWVASLSAMRRPFAFAVALHVAVLLLIFVVLPTWPDKRAGIEEPIVVEMAAPPPGSGKPEATPSPAPAKTPAKPSDTAENASPAPAVKPPPARPEPPSPPQQASEPPPPKPVARSSPPPPPPSPSPTPPVRDTTPPPPPAPTAEPMRMARPKPKAEPPPREEPQKGPAEKAASEPEPAPKVPPGTSRNRRSGSRPKQSQSRSRSTLRPSPGRCRTSSRRGPRPRPPLLRRSRRRPAKPATFRRR